MKNRSSTKNPWCCAWVALAVILWGATPPDPSGATTYYVDANHPSARDSNPGTESLPFQTIGRATSLVDPGDTVFIKEGVYRETVILSRSGTFTTYTGRNGLTTIASPITFMAYPGHEGRVVINAAEPVTDWHPCVSPQECAGNSNWQSIYWADVATLVQSHPDAEFAVRQVFQHGRLLPRSRYPNRGWRYPTGISDPMGGFVDSGLLEPSGYFNGAVCHIKTAVWQIDQIPIADFSRGTITLSRSPRYAITTRFGYYLTNIVGEIDEEGEWAYDPAQKRIYLWPQGNNVENVEVSYRRYCLRSYAGTSRNVVRGLTLRNAYLYGIFLYRSNDMTIENNTIEYAYDFGVQVYAGAGGVGDNTQILRNTIRYCAYRGINVDIVCIGTNVEGNTVYATGAESFGDDLMNGRGEAIYVSGPYTRVFNNRIDRTGHTGIYVSGDTLGRDISYNYMTNAGLALSDGGGIYTAGFSDVPEKDRIHHNILVDILGCLSMDRSYDNGGTPAIDTHSGESSGIYVDEEGNNRIIEHNTVIGSRMAGIYFHWAPSNLVQKNTLYGNTGAQIRLDGKNEARKMLLDDTLLDNILFATNAGQRTLYVGINYGNVLFGWSDRNYFYNPFDDAHVFVSRYFQNVGTVRQNLTLDGWRELSGYDATSREFSSLEHLDGAPLANPIESRIVYNPTLDTATVDLEGTGYCDVQGNPVAGTVILEPFESKILIALD